MEYRPARLRLLSIFYKNSKGTLLCGTTVLEKIFSKTGHLLWRFKTRHRSSWVARLSFTKQALMRHEVPANSPQYPPKSSLVYRRL